MRIVISPPLGIASRALHREVHDHLENLALVGLHEPEVSPVLHLHLDLLAERPAHGGQVLLHDIGQLQYGGAERLFAGVGEDLGDKPSRAGGAALDVHHILEGRIGGAEPAQQQVRVTDNGGQQVVEIVRDAACKLANRLQLLALHRFLAAKRRRPGLNRGDDEIAAIRGRKDDKADAAALGALEHGLQLDGAIVLAPRSPRLAIRSRTFCEEASATSSASDLPQSSVFASSPPLPRNSARKAPFAAMMTPLPLVSAIGWGARASKASKDSSRLPAAAEGVTRQRQGSPLPAK